MTKTLTWKRLTPIAACLVMVIAITTIFGNNAGWFADKIYTAELSGGTIKFHKVNGGTGSMAFELGVDGTARDLTTYENTLLFGEAFGSNTAVSHGFFSIDDKYVPDMTLLHVEAKTTSNQTDNGLKIIMAASSLGYTSDALIETSRNVSVVNGVNVSTGYWTTRENSRGERNIIYLAAFEQGGVTVYVEGNGRLENEQRIRADVANAVDALTRYGAPAMVNIKYDTDISKQTGLYKAGGAWLSLFEGGKYALSGAAEISYNPSGSYTVEDNVMKLFIGDDETFRFLLSGDTLIFESGEWLENWVEPGTVFIP